MNNAPKIYLVLALASVALSSQLAAMNKTPIETTISDEKSDTKLMGKYIEIVERMQEHCVNAAHEEAKKYDQDSTNKDEILQVSKASMDASEKFDEDFTKIMDIMGWEAGDKIEEIWKALQCSYNPGSHADTVALELALINTFFEEVLDQLCEAKSSLEAL